MLEKFFFKKIEIWILILVIFLGIIILSFYGGLLRSYYMAGNRFSTLGEIAVYIAEIPTKTSKSIISLTSNRYEVINNRNFNNKENLEFFYEAGSRPDLGYILISRYNSDANTNVVELIDLNFQEIVHVWKGNNHDSLDHPLLLKDGKIVSKDYSTGSLFTLDLCQKENILNKEVFLHHSTEIDHDGNLWIPIRYFPKYTKNYANQNDELLIDHGIAKFSSESGKLLFHKNLLDMIYESDMAHHLYAKPWAIDPTHLNDIQPVMKDGEYWKKGDLFLSLRNQSAIMLYRPSIDQVIWYKHGPWVGQHDVDIISDYEISIYNNNVKTGLNENFINDIIIYNFKTNETHSPFNSSFIKHDIRTSGGGLHEFINDNEVVVEETWEGRLIHINNNGNLLWQFINKGQDNKHYYLHWSRLIDRELGNIVRNLSKNKVCDEN